MSELLFWALAAVSAAVAVPRAFFWAIGRIDRMVARDRKPWAPPVVSEREGVWPGKVLWVGQPATFDGCLGASQRGTFQ